MFQNVFGALLTERVKRLESFQVHEDYRNIRVKEDAFTKENHDIIDGITINSRIIEKCKDGFKNESGDDIKIGQIYDASLLTFLLLCIT